MWWIFVFIQFFLWPCWTVGCRSITYFYCNIKIWSEKGSEACQLNCILQIAHFFELIYSLHERISIEECKSIQEDNDTQNGSWNQQPGVPAQPQVIQSHLLSKIWPESKIHQYLLWRRNKITVKNKCSFYYSVQWFGAVVCCVIVLVFVFLYFKLHSDNLMDISNCSNGKLYIFFYLPHKYAEAANHK